MLLKAFNVILNRYKNQVALETTTIELLDEIYKVTPKEHHELVNDWFKRVITYNLKVEDATVNPTLDGKYRIDVKIASKRFEYQKDGSSKEIEINEPIRIGVFNKHPKSYRLNDRPIYYQHQKINGNTTDLTIIVDEFPTHIAIDPYGTRNDENYSDNVFRIEYQ